MCSRAFVPLVPAARAWLGIGQQTGVKVPTSMVFSGRQVNGSQTLRCLRTHWKAFPCKLLGPLSRLDSEAQGQVWECPRLASPCVSPLRSSCCLEGWLSWERRGSQRETEVLVRWEMGKRARANRGDEDAFGEVQTPSALEVPAEVPRRLSSEPRCWRDPGGGRDGI